MSIMDERARLPNRHRGSHDSDTDHSIVRTPLSETPTAVGTPTRHLSPSCSRTSISQSGGIANTAHQDPSSKSAYAMPEEVDHGVASPRDVEQGLSAIEALRTEAQSGSVQHGGLRSDLGVTEKSRDVDFGDGPEEVIVIDWLPNDPENPFNWPTRKKVANAATGFLIGALTAVNCTSVAPMAVEGAEWFGVSRELFELSFTVMLLAISFGPLVLAPLSESLGRMWIYQVTSIVNALMFLPPSLSHSYSGLLVSRAVQGISSSVGNSLVGGTVADMFRAKERGLAMCFYSLAIYFGQGSGVIFGGWVVIKLGVPWCYGIQGLLGAVSVIINIIVLRETRSDVLLSRRAKRLTRETGRRHVCAADLETQSIVTMLRVSLVRPLQFLLTEPIVTALSIWIAFVWACTFLGGTSDVLVFSSYGFSSGQANTFQVAYIIGGIIGFITNFHQEHLYARAAKKNSGRAPPEARLYWAAYGGLLFPLSLYIFAWTGRPGIPWAIPAVVLCFVWAGVFIMYTAIFNYFADAYETYSSSAQASQGFARNILSGVFPLFAKQMYEALGYPQASTVVASIALVLQIAPILLIPFGKRLRARSKIAKAIEKDP